MAEPPLSLLVVDDDSIDRMAILRALRGLKREHVVEEATTLADARARIAVSAFDCVITDYRLPDGEAIQLLDALRRSDGYLSAPVVVVTGLEDEEAAHAAVKDGAQDYLHKSDINARSLSRTLRHAIQRHEMVEQLKQRDEMLRQSQRMESISKLAGGIAHDFNNMLTVIGGFSSVAMMKLGDHPASKDLQQVMNATDRLTELTSEILAFASKQVLEPEVLCLSELLTQTQPLLARLLGAGVQLSVGSRGQARVEVDRASFQQALLNLASNATDAMPEGGLFDVSLEDVQLESGQVPELEAGHYVHLTVRDSGSGMVEEVKGQAFDPFFTTKRFGTSTGLGLAMVHGFVKQSHGAIAVESVVGQGTTFHIWLPRVDAPTPETPTLRPSQLLRRGSRTIMIAEDEPMVRALLRDTLAAEGYTVVTARDGAQALNLARSHEGEIDLLITDVVMPVLGGLELAEAFAVERPQTLILFMSGNALPQDRVREQNFFPKPVAPAQIVNAAHTLIGTSTPKALSPWNLDG